MRVMITDKGTKVYLVEVVKGLLSESNKVSSLLKKVDFQVGALPISKEELIALKDIEGELPEDEMSMSTPEIAYSQNLEKFGKVMMPPPSYSVLIEYCRKNDIKVVGIDMDEEHFTAAYCRHVSGLELIRQSMWEKKLLRRKFESSSPKDFALEWDKLVNRFSGFQKLEYHREKVMSKNIKRLTRAYDVFFIVEYERLEGILSVMDGWGWEEKSS